MEGRILPLSEVVRSQLRSGITITSVAQCVEELVLNSLDAEATCIAVRIDLGIFKIQVVDNGTGIQERDLQYLGTRHATSKCHSLEDLTTNLSHYGFRGEALASTVDVSAVVDVCTRSKDSKQTLTKLFTYGKEKMMGGAKSNRPSVGTTITIQDFMYNMPVRRKIIKEAIDIENVRKRLESFALMHPKVSFSLRNDRINAMVLHTKKTNSQISTFMQLFGNERAQGLAEVEHSLDQFTLSGYISTQPHINKAIQFVYVNKRVILKTKLHKMLNWLLARSSIISSRIHPGSGGSGKPNSPVKGMRLYGIFFINIECPYNEYDVCLEPTKTLVEFRDWDKLLICIEEMFLKFIQEEDLVISLSERFRRSGRGNDEGYEDAEEDDKTVTELGVFSLKRAYSKDDPQDKAGPKYGRTICTQDNLLAVHSLPVKRPKKNVQDTETEERDLDGVDQSSARELRSSNRNPASVNRKKYESDEDQGNCEASSSTLIKSKKLKKEFNLSGINDSERYHRRNNGYQKPARVDSEDGASDSDVSRTSARLPSRLSEEGEVVQVNDKRSRGDSESESIGSTAGKTPSSSQVLTTLEEFKRNITGGKVCDSDDGGGGSPGKSKATHSGTAQGLNRGKEGAHSRFVFDEEKTSNRRISGTAVEGDGEGDGTDIGTGARDSETVMGHQHSEQRNGQTRARHSLTTLEEFVNFCKGDGIRPEQEEARTPPEAVRHTPSTPPPLRESRRVTLHDEEDSSPTCESSVLHGSGQSESLYSKCQKNSQQVSVSHMNGLHQKNSSFKCNNVLTLDDYENNLMKSNKKKDKEDTGKQPDGRKTSALCKSLGEKLRRHQSQVKNLQTLRKFEYCKPNTVASSLRLPGTIETTNIHGNTDDTSQESEKVERSSSLVWKQQENVCSMQNCLNKDEQDADILESSFKFQPVIRCRKSDVFHENSPVYEENCVSHNSIPVSQTSDMEKYVDRTLSKEHWCNVVKKQNPADQQTPGVMFDPVILEKGNQGSFGLEKRGDEKQEVQSLNSENQSFVRLSKERQLSLSLNDENSVFVQPDNQDRNQRLGLRVNCQAFTENETHCGISETEPGMSNHYDSRTNFSCNQLGVKEIRLDDHCIQRETVTNQLHFGQGTCNGSQPILTKNMEAQVTLAGKVFSSTDIITSISSDVTRTVSPTQPFDVDSHDVRKNDNKTMHFSDLPESQGFPVHSLERSDIDKCPNLPESVPCSTSDHTSSFIQKLEDIAEVLHQIENHPEASESWNISRAVKPSSQNANTLQAPSLDEVEWPKTSQSLMEDFIHSTPVSNGDTETPNVRQEPSACDAKMDRRVTQRNQDDTPGTSSQHPFSESLYFSQLTIPEGDESLPSLNSNSSTVMLMEQTDRRHSPVASLGASSDSGSENIKRSLQSCGISFHGKMIHIDNKPTFTMQCSEGNSSGDDHCIPSVSAASKSGALSSVQSDQVTTLAGSKCHKSLESTEMVKESNSHSHRVNCTEGSKKLICVESPACVQEEGIDVRKVQHRKAGCLEEQHTDDQHHNHKLQEDQFLANECSESQSPGRHNLEWQKSSNKLSEVQNGFGQSVKSTGAEEESSVTDGEHSQGTESSLPDHPARRWREIVDHDGRKVYVNLQTGNTSYDPPQVDDAPEWSCSQSLGAPILKVPLTHEPWFHPRGNGKKAREDFSLTHGFTDFLSWKKRKETEKEPSFKLNSGTSSADSASRKKILSEFKESCRLTHSAHRVQEADSVQKDLETETISGSDPQYPDELGLSDVARICHNWEGPDFAMDAEVLNTGMEQITSAGRIHSKRDAMIKVYNAVHPYKFTKDMLQTCKVVGQVDNKYIACCLTYPWLDPDGTTLSPTQLVVLFDQHAAHERVRLEAITRENYETSLSGEKTPKRGDESAVPTLRSATVSPPLQLALPPHEIRLMAAFPHIFKRRGLHFSQVNSEMVSFHAIPSCLVAREASEARHRRCQMAVTTVESTIRDLCHQLQKTGGVVPPIPTPISNVLNSQACRGAVKFGDALSVEQCQELVSALATCQLPFQCAHGRPSIMPLINLAHLPPLPLNVQRNKPCLWKLKEALKTCG